MSKNLKLYLLFLLSLSYILMPNNISAQGYYYSYDDSGNRYTRTYTIVFLRQVERFDDTIKTITMVEKHQISVYPNPTDGDLNVEITNLTDGTSARIELFFRYVGCYNLHK